MSIRTLLLSLLFSAAVYAQVTTATIYGVVQDPTGAGVPGANVTARHEQTSSSKSTTTSDRGEFTLTFLPVGTYTVTISAQGFKQATSQGVELSAGQKADLSYRLELGTATESVTVTGEAPLINTTTVQESNRLGTQQVKELPMPRRDITALLNLGEGVAADGTTIAVNGLPPRGFTFTVDGVDASPDSEFPSLSLYQNYNYVKGVSVEAVKEVEVAKNIFSAEIANTVSGNVNLITKSGTNSFHGSLFELYQSGGLNAVNHLSTLKTSAVYHQFGGSLGGPIVRDKLFFFGAFEAYRLHETTPVTTNVPSRQVRALITAAQPSFKPYLDEFQLPTEPERPGDVVAFFAGTGATERNDDHGVVRVDYNLSANNQVNARYTDGHPYQQSPRTALLSNWRKFDGQNRNVSATFTRVWSPLLTSETRFGYNRSYTDRTDNAYLEKLVAFGGAGIPSVDGELFIKWGTVTSLEQSFAKAAGIHSLKFGGSLRWARAMRINEEIPIYSYSTVADILANRPSNGRYVFLLDEFQIRRWQGGAFVQDDMRLKPNLIVNLGMRYDYDSVPGERDGRYFNRDGPFGAYLPPDSPWNAYHTMFSPRVGMAWTVGKARKTSIRSGFGIFFIPHNLFEGPVEIVLNGPKEPYEVTSVSGTQLQQLGIRYPFTNPEALPLIRRSFIISDSAIDKNWENSYSLQWSFNIDHQLSETLAFDVGYVGTRGVKLTYSPNVNRIDPLTGLRPNEAFGEFRYYQSADSSVYHALQAALKKRFARGLQFNVHYTYASNLAYYQGDYNCCGTGNGPQDLARLDLNRGPTSYHIRHRFLTDFVYETPNPWRGSNRAAEHVLGGWQVAGIFEGRTGTPLLISQGVPNTPGARHDYVGASFHDAIAGNWNDPVLPGGFYQYLNQRSFAQAPLGRFGALLRPGNLGRNQIYGPGLWNVDLSLSKNVRVKESLRLQFRADLFNAFNHTVLSGVDTNVLSSRFGRVTSVRPGRVTQLSVRFDF